MEDQAQDTVYEVTIYLKNGVSFTVDCAEFMIQRHKLSGKLSGLHWSSPSSTTLHTYSVLRYANVDDISAIVQREKQ